MEIGPLNEFARAVRKKLGFTQASFAELMGPRTTRAMVANYELGRAKVPGEVVFRIMAGIGAVVDIRDCYKIVLPNRKDLGYFEPPPDPKIY